MSGSFVLAAGGTGGHLFPAEALAAELVGHGRQVHLLTDSRADAFAAQVPDVAIHNVRAGRLGGGPVRAAYGLAELAAGTVQARRLLRRLRPAAVIGFGGYPSVPTMLAAASLGLPTMIHEQNAVLGRANRLLASRAGPIATGFPETAGLRPADRIRAVHTGNPVRPAMLALAGRRIRSAGARRADRAAGLRRQPGRPHPGRSRAGGVGDLAARMAPTVAGQPAGPSRGSSPRSSKAM